MRPMPARVSVLLVLAAFLLIGFVGWVVGMPRPAQPVSPAVNQLLGATNEQADATSAAETPLGAGAPTPLPPDTPQPTATVAAEWVTRIAAATSIPARALQAYADAAVAQRQATPGCGLGWNVLAAIGMVESAHGTFDGAHIGDDGEVVGSILGPVLDGTGYPAVRDTDHGVLDGDRQWDRAVGPMQFLPGTWQRDGVDGNNDGKVDPENIDDAARTAAAYLCQGGRDLSNSSGWTAAIAAYNPSNDYLTEVSAQANDYARAVT